MQIRLKKLDCKDNPLHYILPSLLVINAQDYWIPASATNHYN